MLNHNSPPQDNSKDNIFIIQFKWQSNAIGTRITNKKLRQSKLLKLF